MTEIANKGVFPKKKEAASDVVPKQGATYKSIYAREDKARIPGKTLQKAPIRHIIPGIDTLLVMEGEKMVRKSLIYSTEGGFVKRNGQEEWVKKEAVIAMEKGYLTVGPHEQELYEYLETCNYNGSNPNRNKKVPILFYRIDEVKNRKNEANKEKEHIANMNIFYDMLKDPGSQEILLNYLTVSGIDHTDMDPETIEAELTIIAKHDSKKFVDNVANPINTRIAEITQAIKGGILEYKGEGSKFFWKGMANHIYHVPAGVTDPVQNFAEWTITDKGESVYAELRKRLKLK